MNTQEYERMFRTEDSYWWFIGRHDLVETFIIKQYGTSAHLRILDIGCGTGAMSTRLSRWGDVISADFSPVALSYSRKRRLNKLCAADAMHLPFKDASFDLIVSLDILEHLPDDHAAMKELYRVLKPGGRLISTVPAYTSLWSGHDEALMHQRRYVAREIKRLVEHEGLHIERLSYAMTFLYPIVAVVRILTRHSKKPQASLVAVSPFVNRALIGLLKFENRLIRRFRLPYGVTVFCMAVRPLIDLPAL